jgi:ATP-binding cassette subfamily B protein
MTASNSRSSRQRYRDFVDAYRRARVREGGSSVPRDPRYLNQYVRWILPHWRTIALVFGLAIAAEGLKMAEPLLMRFIVDHILLDSARDASARLRRLNVMGAGFVGLVILMHLINLLKDHRQRLMDVRVKVSLRRSLIERLLDLPLSRLAEMKTGGILSRLTGDVDVTSGILQQAVVFPAVSLIRLLIAGGILLTLNWQLALTALAALPGLVVVSFAMAKRVRPIYVSIRRDAEEIDGRAGEAFGGIRIVRAFHREARELLEYMRGQHTMLRKDMFAYRRELLLWLAWGLLLGGANVVIVWYGGYLHLRGRASLGDILAFQWYTLLLLGPVLNIAHSFSQLQRSQAATERVFKVLSMERDKPDRPGALEAPGVVRSIRFEHVDFEYREGRPVIRDFNVTVPGGAMVALVGRSGAGKTTVTDLVGRFHDPTRGRITLNGTDIRDFRIRSYRSLFAIVEQHVFLFDGSVRENIAYGCPKAGDLEVEYAARRANAHGFIERLPDGYDTHVGERGVKLSGGQQQRLAIARAFLKAPAILIMDEATSNLDTESEQLIQASVRELMASRTAFVIAHRLSTIQRADLILVVDDGRIVEQGGHEELMANRGEYRDMVVRQMIAIGERSAEVFR